MGNGASKDEQLYQAVLNGNTSAVNALRHDGASLESMDKEGRTPLMIACTRGNLFDMVLTLLNLGANINAYQPGSHGGQPLHQAAKLGLDRTVFLLLSRGADPLAVNDDSLTPLDLARNRGHLSVVRMIEDRVAIFTGMLRELSGLGFLEAIAPQWVTKKIWAAVVPTGSDTRKPPKYELVIYLSFKNPLPRTIISLSRAEVEEPKFNMPDPVLVLTDRNTRTKYKFLAEAPGDKAQIERLFWACKGVEQTPGIPPQAVLQGMAAMIRPAAQQHQSQPHVTTQSPNSGKLKHPSERTSDEALRMGIDASLRTAAAESSNLGGWGNDDIASSSDFNGWGSSTDAGPSSAPRPSEEVPEPERERMPEPLITSIPEYHPTETYDSSSTSLPAVPSAPSPTPPQVLDQVASISYPQIDASPVEVDYLADAQPSPSAPPVGKTTDEKAGQCVVCWDAPAQAVCIPCGHLAGCMDCLSEIKEKGWGCPVCRTAIQQVVKVYTV